MSFLDKIKSIFTGQEKPAENKRGDRKGGERKRDGGQTSSRRDERGGSGRGRRRHAPHDKSESREHPQRSEHDKSLGGEAKSPGSGRKRKRRSGRRTPGEGGTAQPQQAVSAETSAAPRQRDRGGRPPRESGTDSGRHTRSRRTGRTRGKPSELGGVAQRVEFPELLEINTDSEEFRSNEFRPLGLSEHLLLTLAANRFRTPTDIQREMIPEAIKGRDILGQAKTGTGKTIAFLMPIFERVDHSRPDVQALIVVPTRELCRQVAWEAQRFGRTLETRAMAVYGGTSVKKEIDLLQLGPHLVIGTPGRLLDHISNRNLDLSKLKVLVLDEADRMFDIGFRQDIIKIIKACSEDRQIMLLSATMDQQVEELSERFMKNPVQIYVSKDEISVESIWQRFIPSERGKKIEKLVTLLKKEKPTQSIVFANTKRMSDSLALRLGKLGFKAQCIHSDLSQNKRERIMDEFRTGKIEHLVATDVAARGLDITGISHVINYDIPANPEDYVHRVGRTGRMGAAGKAFTFVQPSEGKELSAVEKLINKQLGEYEFE